MPQELVKKLVAPAKGILAADESTNTVAKRFSALNIENSEENRRAYREMLFTTPGIENYLSGIILFDETLRQSTEDGIRFVDLLNKKNIIPGIKVDLGTENFTENSVEKFTKGLETLDERLKEYYELGARFAKWRAVFFIGENLPTEQLIDRNSSDLAEYARVCQANNFVPIVEPEVLMEGNHSIEKCYEVTKKVLQKVFEKLKEKDVDLKAMLLKPNMIVAGSEIDKTSSEKVAELTLQCFKETVPEEVQGIVFLSGGQGEDEATENLNAINLIENNPWQLSFSFGRALQNSALETWGGKEENIEKSKEVFLERIKLVSSAREGKLQVVKI